MGGCRATRAPARDSGFEFSPGFSPELLAELSEGPFRFAFPPRIAEFLYTARLSLKSM
jgi:hypothetical protein